MDFTQALPDSPVVRGALAAAVLFLSTFLWNYQRSPLRKVPGPLLARFTDLWRVGSWWTGRTHLRQIELHRQYGRTVLLGPTTVSISDANLVNAIYSSKTPWLKSDMYSSNDVVVDGVVTSNIFATKDQEWHTKMIKPIRNMNTNTKTLAFEAGVDETIDKFCAQMDRMASDGTIVPLEKWFLWFAYDCLHKLTFGFHRGYVEEGGDVGNFIKDAYGSLVYFGLCASMPVLDRLIVKNPLVKPFLGEPPFLWAFQQAFTAVVERKQKHENEGTSPGSSDYLDLFLGARDTFPNIVTGDDVVVNYLFLNLVAGSDTTGTSLAVILYYVYRNPAILAKVRHVLDTEKIDQNLPATYRDTNRLPYFDAVVQEGLRIHPPIGLTLERVVPTGGWQIPGGGPFLPADTKVGVNAWVTNRDEKVYGPENVDDFVPERWMPRDGESDEAWKSRIRSMKGVLMTFGFGPRVCSGKNVAMLELYKLVATFITKYDLEFMNPEWKTENIWFVFPTGFDVKIKQRS